MTLDPFALVKSLFDFLPNLDIFRPLPRQYDTAVFPFRRVEENINLVAHFHLKIALSV
jgi:hypothetical protein